MPTSEQLIEEIRGRLAASGADMAANANISAHLRVGDLVTIEMAVEKAMEGVLDALLIDRKADHNTAETAARVARMYVREVFAGRYQPEPAVTDFPNVKEVDELYTVGPITVRSTCSHHLCPIIGDLWCGIIPGDRVVGLSKFTRMAEHVMGRPQIQEEAVMQLADMIEGKIRPRGLALVLRATHNCMAWRGVRDRGTTMASSVMRGLLRTDAAARGEFLALIGGQRFTCA